MLKGLSWVVSQPFVPIHNPLIQDDTSLQVENPIQLSKNTVQTINDFLYTFPGTALKCGLVLYLFVIHFTETPSCKFPNMRVHHVSLPLVALMSALAEQLARPWGGGPKKTALRNWLLRSSTADWRGTNTSFANHSRGMWHQPASIH